MPTAQTRKERGSREKKKTPLIRQEIFALESFADLKSNSISNIMYSEMLGEFLSHLAYLSHLISCTLLERDDG